MFGILVLTPVAVLAQAFDVADLARLQPGRTLAQNALWKENPLDKQFRTSKRVTVAEIDGPAVITMIHFAVPASQFRSPSVPLDRDLLIKMYWDEEKTPSVDCPLVDFFCDPAGERTRVNTALVNKCRGFNAYFPMPFANSAKIELVYDGALEPGDELWARLPCYSYVMYRELDQLPDDTGYFHAHWRKQELLLGKRDYVALDAVGHGKFVGWNVAWHLANRPAYGTVDMNERFYVDGEKTPSIELQGIEDSFGFSWGFPPEESFFPLTGYFPFRGKGAAAYRWFLNDAIGFEKSLYVEIGFGENEHPGFRKEYSKPENELVISSVVYWYQKEPHAPLPPLPSAKDR